MEFELNGVETLSPIVPYMSETTVNEIARKSFEHHGIHSIVSLAPFINKELLNELALATVAKNGLSELTPIMPYLDQKVFVNALLNPPKPSKRAKQAAKRYLAVMGA